jgi:hypothetical protein
VFYKSREFCKASGCSNQKFLDDPKCPEEAKVFFKEISCKECVAYKFHTYLQNEGYSIVKLPGTEKDIGFGNIVKVLDIAYLGDDDSVVTFGVSGIRVFENEQLYKDDG